MIKMNKSSYMVSQFGVKYHYAGTLLAANKPRDGKWRLDLHGPGINPYYLDQILSSQTLCNVTVKRVPLFMLRPFKSDEYTFDLDGTKLQRGQEHNFIVARGFRSPIEHVLDAVANPDEFETWFQHNYSDLDQDLDMEFHPTIPSLRGRGKK